MGLFHQGIDTNSKSEGNKKKDLIGKLVSPSLLQLPRFLFSVVAIASSLIISCYGKTL